MECKKRMAKAVHNSIVINKYKWVKPTYSLIYQSDITLLKVQLHFFNSMNLVLDFYTRIPTQE